MLRIFESFTINITFNLNKKYLFTRSEEYCCLLLNSSRSVNNCCGDSIRKYWTSNFSGIYQSHNKRKLIAASPILNYLTRSSSLCENVENKRNMTSSLKKHCKKTKKENHLKSNDDNDRKTKKRNRKIRKLLKSCKTLSTVGDADVISDDLVLLTLQKKILKKQLKLLHDKTTNIKDDSNIDENNSCNINNNEFEFSNLKNRFTIESIEEAVANFVSDKFNFPSDLGNNKNTDKYRQMDNRLSSPVQHILRSEMASLKFGGNNDTTENLLSESSVGMKHLEITESNGCKEPNLNVELVHTDVETENDLLAKKSEDVVSGMNLGAKKQNIKEILEEEKFKELRQDQYTIRAAGLIEEPCDPNEKQFKFKVVSYNVLSQTLLVDNMRLYRNHNRNYLNWTYRSNLLWRELDKLDADILCLQEVQEDHKVIFFDQLKNKGYEGIYKKRTGDKVDGCAIYYKKSKFQLVDYASVEFYQPGIDLLNRDNVAVIVKLHPIGFPKNPLVVATTHLLYNPRRHDVKLSQMQVLLAEIERYAFKDKNSKFQYHPVILTGDFNLEPYTAVYQLLVCKQLCYEVLDRKKLMYAGPRPYPDKEIVPPPYGPPMGKRLLPSILGITDTCEHYGIMKTRDFPYGRKTQDYDFQIGLYNSDRRNTPREFPECERMTDLFSTGLLKNLHFDFHSVYDHEDDQNEFEATTRHDEWLTCDYILYTPLVDPKYRHCQLQVISRSRLPLVKECQEHIKNIPNRICPSDHLPLISTFFLRIPSKPV